MNVKSLPVLYLGTIGWGFCVVANAQTVVSGSNVRGLVTQSLAVSGPAALLNSFDVNFGFGNDHKITAITVQPTEASQSVSIGYYDKNSDDAFAYRAGFVSLGQQVYTNEHSGQCAGRCSIPVPVPAGYKFVLRGFDYRFLSSDHHLLTIGAEHGNNSLKVYYHDKNSDDRFSYRVKYALVPNTLLSSVSSSSGNGAGQAQTSITSGKTVIRGFMFSFLNGDHHVSRIRVAPANGTLNVAFTDKNYDDPFSWRVQWAILK